MTTYFARSADVQDLLGEHQAIPTFTPNETQHLAWMDAAGEEVSTAVFSQPRAAQSPKGFFLPATESMGRYGEQVQTGTAVDVKPMVLAGVRACELRSRNYLDKVLQEGEFADPLYVRRREVTTIVSCDCADCTESCFCTLVGGQPFVTEGFDVNLTPVEGGFIVEVATEKGRQWLGDKTLSEATGEQLARRDQLRKEIVERLEKQNAEFDFTASDQTSPKLPDDGDEAWQQFAADCVECGACTNICPTCHCFYLYDQALGPEQFERVRTWDSCLLGTYHRMAGGVSMKLSPRPSLFSRLGNRVLHKFAYSSEQYGLLGCVGCGRCIDACAGAIDIRQVVQELKE